MLEAPLKNTGYDWKEALKTGKPRNNFDAMLLRLDASNPELAEMFIAVAQWLGWDRNLMSAPLANSTAAHKTLSDIPDIEYKGDADLLKQTAVAAIETMEEKGRIAFEDQDSRAEFIAEAGQVAEQSLVDGKFDHHAFEQSLIDSADRLNINFLKFNDPSPEALDFSHEVKGKLEFKDGNTVFTPADGGEGIVIPLQILDIYDLADSERDKLVMDQVAYIETTHLPQHFPDSVTLQAVALQDADADASNAEVVAWRLSSDDKNYYIGQDSFATPQQQWHPSLSSGFEENRVLDNDNNLSADQQLSINRLDDIDNKIAQASNSNDLAALQKLQREADRLLHDDKPQQPQQPSQSLGFGF